ncbi:hypothetical protein PAXRUDRAFT_16464 [Paxillus rubicundulus Ve08.2h10]|uniref:Uncharacterized protein n=1 Tax=Paxillus rubicundulus Ve08.2h10 TaxID=930991 RepID=A0A0D0C8B9_9AGAM|nr:hypothetical protein PAXRUDRAFT_16464 [Paxillus rubicundulus Ve08.2h10]
MAKAPHTPKKSTLISASKPASKQGKRPNKEKSWTDDDPKKSCAVILWAKSGNFHLTDALLTLIEDSVTWKGALGFDRGAINDPMPTGKGAIEKKFSWYLWMSALMGSSPVLSWKAISNSRSYLDLAVLGVDDDADEDETEHCTPTPMVDEDVALRSIEPLSLCGNLPSDKLEDEEEEVVFLPKIKLTVPAKHATESPAVSQYAKKHKLHKTW